LARFEYYAQEQLGAKLSHPDDLYPIAITDHGDNLALNYRIRKISAC
jgi:hypothetical protein